MVITDVAYDFNKDLLTMVVSLRQGDNGIPVVDLDAELFEDIAGDLFVSDWKNLLIMKKEPRVNQ